MEIVPAGPEQQLVEGFELLMQLDATTESKLTFRGLGNEEFTVPPAATKGTKLTKLHIKDDKVKLIAIIL